MGSAQCCQCCASNDVTDAADFESIGAGGTPRRMRHTSELAISNAHCVSPTAASSTVLVKDSNKRRSTITVDQKHRVSNSEVRGLPRSRKATLPSSTEGSSFIVPSTQPPRVEELSDGTNNISASARERSSNDDTRPLDVGPPVLRIEVDSSGNGDDSRRESAVETSRRPSTLCSNGGVGANSTLSVVSKRGESARRASGSTNSQQSLSSGGGGKGNYFRIPPMGGDHSGGGSEGLLDESRRGTAVSSDGHFNYAREANSLHLSHISRISGGGGDRPPQASQLQHNNGLFPFEDDIDSSSLRRVSARPIEGNSGGPMISFMDSSCQFDESVRSKKTFGGAISADFSVNVSGIGPQSTILCGGAQGDPTTTTCIVVGPKPDTVSGLASGRPKHLDEKSLFYPTALHASTTSPRKTSISICEPPHESDLSTTDKTKDDKSSRGETKPRLSLSGSTSISDRPPHEGSTRSKRKCATSHAIKGELFSSVLSEVPSPKLFLGVSEDRRGGHSSGEVTPIEVPVLRKTGEGCLHISPTRGCCTSSPQARAPLPPHHSQLSAVAQFSTEDFGEMVPEFESSSSSDDPW